MLCPNCGHENGPEAPSCDLCSVVLRKDAPAPPKPAPPPAPAPGEEPLKLDSLGAVKALLTFAEKMGREFRFDEAERAMARLFMEADPETCGDLLAVHGAEWLKVSPLAPGERPPVEALLAAVTAGARKGELAGAAEASRTLAAAIKEGPPEAARLQLFLLGLKGAVARGAGKPAAPAEAAAPPAGTTGRPAEPKVLDTVESWGELVLLAQYAALSGDVKEAGRLTTRLFTELALNDCERLIVAAAEMWLEAPGMTAELKKDARDTVARAGACVAKDDFASAHALLRGVAAKIKLEPGPALRLGLLALGVKGAAAAKRR